MVHRLQVRQPSGPLPVQAMLRAVVERYAPLAPLPRGQVAAQADFTDLAGVEGVQHLVCAHGRAVHSELLELVSVLQCKRSSSASSRRKPAGRSTCSALPALQFARYLQYWPMIRRTWHTECFAWHRRAPANRVPYAPANTPSPLAWHAELDADLGFGVFVTDPALCEDGTAKTEALLVEEGTGRPLLGYTFVCARWLGSTLAYLRLLTHEVVHALVRLFAPLAGSLLQGCCVVFGCRWPNAPHFAAWLPDLLWFRRQALIPDLCVQSKMIVHTAVSHAVNQL